MSRGLTFNDQQFIIRVVSEDIAKHYDQSERYGSCLKIHRERVNLELPFFSIPPYPHKENSRSFKSIACVPENEPVSAVHSARLCMNVQTQPSWQAFESVLQEPASIKTLVDFIKIGNETGIRHYICSRESLKQLEIVLKAKIPGLFIKQVEGYPIERPEGYALDYAELLIPPPLWLPIRQFEDKDHSPLETLDHAIKSLPKNITAFLQVLFKGARYPWRPNFWQQVNSMVQRTKLHGHVFYEEDLLRDAKIKMDPSQPIIAFLPRVGVIGPPGKVEKHLEDLLAHFDKFLVGGQPLMKIHKVEFIRAGHSNEALWQNITSGRTFIHGSLAVAREVSYFLHLPGPLKLSDRTLYRDTYLGSLDICEDRKEGIPLGENEILGLIVQDPKLRNMGIAIIGRTGKGKSILLANICIWLAKNSYGFLLIDPHGDTIRYVLEHFPKERVDDAILIRPWLDDFTPALNLFSDVRDPAKLADDFVSTLHTLRDLPRNWRRKKRIIKKVTFGVLHLLNPCLGDVLEILRGTRKGKELIGQIIERVEDTHFWTHEYKHLNKEDLFGAAGVLDNIFGHPKLARIFSQRSNKIDLYQCRRQRKILLCDYSEDQLGEETSKILADLTLAKGNQVAKAETALPPALRTFCPTAVDEFQKYETQITGRALRENRKTCTPYFLATQSKGQLPKAVQAALDEAGTTFVLDLEWDDAEQFFKKFCGVLPKQAFVKQPTGYGFVKMGDADPTEIQTPKPLEALDNDVPDYILQNSILKYYVSVNDLKRKAQFRESDEVSKPFKAEFDEIDI